MDKRKKILKSVLNNDICNTSAFKGEIIEVSEEEFEKLYTNKFTNSRYKIDKELYGYNIIKFGEYLFKKTVENKTVTSKKVDRKDGEVQIFQDENGYTVMNKIS